MLSANDRCSKHNIFKETRALNDTLDQMDFTDIYRTLHPNPTEYTFFSRAHGTFSRIDDILGHKSGLNQYQKIRIIPYIFSDHNALTRTKSQKEIWEKLKLLEVKDHPVKR